MNQVCRQCNINKELEEFHKDSSRPLGHRNICKVCYKKYTSREDVRARRLLYHKEYESKNAERRIEYRKKTTDKASLRARKHQLKSKYNLTIDEYDAMVKSQESKCLICSNETSKLVVDHCHNTGKVRGLLCSFCNQGLGLMRDNPKILLNAIGYLNKQ